MPPTGKAAPSRPIAIIDFEASCLPGHGRRSYPIEVAVGLPETGELTIWLIKPEREWLEGWDWYYEAEQMHGLTRPHLLAHGLPRAHVARELLAAVDGHEVLSDCPRYEHHWLSVLIGRDPGLRVGALGALLDDVAGGGRMGHTLRERAAAHARKVAPRTHRAGDDVRHILTMVRELRRLAEEGGWS